jgi:hypothetical protein
LNKNQSALDFRLLLTDVALIADEVDSQLSKSLDRYMRVLSLNAA